jgi:uncharacterized protein YggE
MKVPVRTLLVVSFAALTVPAVAQPCVPTQWPGPHLTASGSAVVRLPPDRVSFSVGVETTDANVSRAFRNNAQKVETVLNALKAKGVQAKELQTSNLEVSSRNPDGTKADGFRVSNRVMVSREDASGVGELIEAAIAAGANDAGQLNFFVANPDGAQARGLELAFASAKAKADTMATLSKRSLGDVLCVAEGSGGGFARSNVAMMASVGGRSVESGTEAIQFDVTVVFALKSAARPSATARSARRGGARTCRTRAARRTAAGCRGRRRRASRAPDARSGRRARRRSTPLRPS